MIFQRVGQRIVAVVGVFVFVGMVGLVSLYTVRQEENILRQNTRAMAQLTESIYQGLQAIMLTGNGDLARSLADHLKQTRDIEDYRIIRTNGVEAFRDNKTISNVNRRRGDQEFLERTDVETVSIVPPDSAELGRALKTQQLISYYEEDAKGEQVLTFLAPMLNQKDCHKCHGGRDAVRGLMKISTSMKAAMANITATRTQALALLVVALGAIMLTVNIVMRRSVVEPMRRVTEAMSKASRGDLTQQVPVLGRDELGQMARSFNHMIGQLLHTYSGLQHEQDKLTTIILGAREGIVVTDAEENVVLVNPATENLVGKPAAAIMRQGFLHLFDDPQQMTAFLNARIGHESLDVIEFNDHFLEVNAARIVSPDGSSIGSAALIRDVTEQKQLQRRLEKLSHTDGLTGLFNRRFIDEALLSEMRRATRYGHPLGLLLFDVDHFKEFNDRYGHDMGDRVLQAIAKEFQHDLRGLDVACRYGGEEFVAIMPNTDAQGALFVAERLRRRVGQTLVDGHTVNISIGVAVFPTEGIATPVEFLAAADRGLYAAKGSGRNCVKMV